MKPSYTQNGTAYYEWNAKSTGPLVLFVHGLGSSAAAWTPVIEKVLEHKDHSILALDLPGFGRSDPTSGSVVGQSVAAIVEVMRTVDDERPVHVVAHSVGGIIAAEASTRSRQIERLTLISTALMRATSVFTDAHHFAQNVGLASAVVLNITAGVVPVSHKRAQTIASSTFLRRVLLWPFLCNTGKPPATSLVSILDHTGGKHTAAAIFDSRHINLEEVFRRVDVPVRLVHGDKDRLIAPDDVTRAASLLGTHDCITIGECGHWPHIEAPSAVAAAVLDFRSPGGDNPS